MLSLFFIDHSSQSPRHPRYSCNPWLVSFQSQAHETYALNLPYWRLSSLVASVERKTP